MQYENKSTSDQDSEIPVKQFGSIYSIMSNFWLHSKEIHVIQSGLTCGACL